MSFSAISESFSRSSNIKTKKAEELFKQYISKGPTDYMADIFANLTGSRNTAYALAIEYYGPMYLMYSLYDEGSRIGRAY